MPTSVRWSAASRAVCAPCSSFKTTPATASPTVIAAAITSQTGKANLPTHISLAARSCGLTRDSVILLEQVRTLDKSRLRERMGRLDEPAMHQVDNAIAVSFGLPQ